MERMLVVIVDNQATAVEASRALEMMAEDGLIGVHTNRVVTKDPDGATKVIKTRRPVPEGTLGGTAVGSLLGALGGYVGIAVGAATGFVLGATSDFLRARVGSTFVAQVVNSLAPGRGAAVVAEIDEEATDAVDARMEALGGFVLRRARSDVVDTEYEQEIAVIKPDLDEARDELAARRNKRKVQLQTTIHSLSRR